MRKRNNKTQRIEGKIVSFSWEKGYGFIKSGKESYFFHKSFFAKDVGRDDIVIGAFFTFEPTPGRKGMQARCLEKTKKLKTYKITNKFIYCKTANPKYGKVLVRTPVKSKMFYSPDEAKGYLYDAAVKSKCNALLNLSYFKDTFSDDNYKYTVHGFEADIALVATPIFIGDKTRWEEAESNLKLLKQEALKQQQIIARERREQYDTNCFIATAVYGNVDCYQVCKFRKFRDEKLRNILLGEQLIKLYYIVSPALAKLLNRSKTMKSCMRVVLDNILKLIDT